MINWLPKNIAPADIMFARSRYHIKTEIKSLMQYSEKILNRDK